MIRSILHLDVPCACLLSFVISIQRTLWRRVITSLIILMLCVFPYTLKATALVVGDVEETATRIDAASPTLKIAYIVTDNGIPSLNVMGRGVKKTSADRGYDLELYDARNSVKNELQQTVKAIKQGVAGIIISPQTSSSCVTVLNLAKKAGIPVVIADIGTDSGEHVSYISSDNWQGAYGIGRVLVANLQTLGWQDGKVGIIAIPQKRLNGQARTAGFMKALTDAGIKSADIKQMQTFTEQETYDYSVALIEKHADLRAIWLQTSNTVDGALRAVSDSGKGGNIVIVAFDAEPKFPYLIRQNIILGSAMQQPYLIGQEALRVMDQHLKGGIVSKHRQLPVLTISKDNIAEQSLLTQKTVLGLDEIY